MPTTASRRSTSSRRRGRRPLRPFTVDHFRAYARNLVLDNGDYWEPEDFQVALVEDLFAGFREAWLIVPEGNGKTTLMAGLALYHGDYRPDPWVPIGASSREQAEIMFSQAAGFVERTPGLDSRFRVYNGYRKIDCKRQGGRGIRVYAADEKTGDGVIPTLCLIDELHRHKDLRLYRIWRGKLDKRDGQIVAISTAGEPETEFETTRERLRNDAEVRDRDGAYLRAASARVVLHEYMLEDGRRPDDFEAVKAANPLSTITPVTLAAKHGDPTQDPADWLRLVCNRPTRAALSAITEQEWDAAQTDEEIPEGVPVAVGLDVAWKWDCTAIVPLWIPEPTRRLFGPPAILVPPRDGNMLDPAEIEVAFERIHARNPIHMVVMDREKGEQLASWLQRELGVERIVDRGRTSAPAAEDYERFMEALRQGWLKHNGDREFRRHAMNAILRHLPGDKKRFDRPNPSRGNPREQDRRVIDALDAASMVNTVAAVQERPPMIAAVAR